MTATYTSGNRVVTAGEDDAFVEDCIGRVRSHCEDFKPSTYELVTTVA